MLYDSIFVKCSDWVNSYRQKVDSWLPGAGVKDGKEEKGMTASEYGGAFEDTEKF